MDLGIRVEETGQAAGPARLAPVEDKRAGRPRRSRPALLFGRDRATERAGRAQRSFPSSFGLRCHDRAVRVNFRHQMNDSRLEIRVNFDLELNGTGLEIRVNFRLQLIGSRL